MSTARLPHTWDPETSYDLGELLGALALVDDINSVTFTMQPRTPHWTRFSLTSHTGGTHTIEVLKGVVNSGIVSQLEFVANCPLYVVRRVQFQIDVLG